MTFNNFINNRRKELNMSIDELVEKSGIPKGTLSKITAGISTNPTLSTVEALCNALKCSLNDAVGYVEDNQITSDELFHIKKYRTLDEYGKEAVDNILDVEHRRCLNDVQNKGKTRLVYKAARSTNGEKAGYVEMSEEEIQRILNAPEADDF